MEGRRRRGEERGSRKVKKTKANCLTNTNMEGLGVSVCHMGVRVSVCARLSVCFIIYDVSVYLGKVCAHIKGKGECRVRRRRVGSVNNSTSSRSTLPSLAVFPHCKSQIDYSNSKTKLARPLGQKPK